MTAISGKRFFLFLATGFLLSSLAIAHAPIYEGEKVMLADAYEEDSSILHDLKKAVGLENDYLPKSVVADYGKHFLLYEISQSGVHNYNVSILSIQDSEYSSLYRAKYNVSIKNRYANATVYLSKDGEQILESPKKLEFPADYELSENRTAGEIVGHQGGHEDGDHHEHS